MRRRLFLASVCILALPVWFSPSPGGNHNSALYSSVAFAGHTVGGTYCDCPSDGCICDDPIKADPSTGETGEPYQDPGATKPSGDESLDFGSTALVAALVFMLWLRLRA